MHGPVVNGEFSHVHRRGACQSDAPNVASRRNACAVVRDACVRAWVCVCVCACVDPRGKRRRRRSWSDDDVRMETVARVVAGGITRSLSDANGGGAAGGGFVGNQTVRWSDATRCSDANARGILSINFFSFSSARRRVVVSSFVRRRTTLATTTTHPKGRPASAPRRRAPLPARDSLRCPS